MQFSNGKFVERVSNPTKTSKTRKLTKGENEGKEVHEELYDSITGLLLDITQESGPFGDMWKFKIDVSTSPENKKVYVLSIPVQFGLANSILFCLKNMDLSQDAEFRGYYFEHDTKKDKFVQGISVYQDKKSKAIGEEKGSLIKVAKFYTNENANGLPPWKESVLNKKKVYDQTDQLVFIEKMVFEEIKPLLPEATPASVSGMEDNEPKTFDADETDAGPTGDDLPF